MAYVLLRYALSAAGMILWQLWRDITARRR